jgi:ubiquinone/menaquinone biosynthesis C-methylase UbiE
MADPPRLDEQKAAIVESWDRRAEQWDEWTPMVDAWFAPPTDRMLEYLRLRPGDSVLELAAGTGGFTRHLARAVGRSGRVIATDSGPQMVKVAHRNAESAGLANVATRVMDGEDPDVEPRSVDAVACRQGVMFFGDPARSFERLARVIRPGGRLVVSVFSVPEHNGFMTTPGAILSRWADPAGATPAPADGPGPYSLSVPGRLEALFRTAGFDGVRVDAVECPLRMPNLDALLRFYRELMGVVVKELPADVQEKAWAEVARACAGYAGPSSFGAPCETLVGVGTVPVTAAAGPAGASPPPRRGD